LPGSSQRAAWPEFSTACASRSFACTRPGVSHYRQLSVRSAAGGRECPDSPKPPSLVAGVDHTRRPPPSGPNSRLPRRRAISVAHICLDVPPGWRTGIRGRHVGAPSRGLSRFWGGVYGIVHSAPSKHRSHNDLRASGDTATLALAGRKHFIPAASVLPRKGYDQPGKYRWRRCGFRLGVSPRCRD
jgi:hypothetical protein